MFDLPLFNKVTISHLWLLKICMFFPSQDTAAVCLNIFFVFSASPFEDCQWRRYGKLLFHRHMVFVSYGIFVKHTLPMDILFSSRIFIVWTVGNEGVWYGWKTCCFWVNYNAEHWRWGQDLKMSVRSIVIVPYLCLETFFSHNMCSLTACVQVKLWNMLCDSCILWHILYL